jgi:C4-dicarboxylate transporter DctM subunit
MSGSLILSGILMVVMLFIGVPVAVSLGVGGMLGCYFYFGSSAFTIGAQIMSSSLESFILLAVPLFITMGVILAKSKVGEKLYDLFDVYLRHIPGGVGVATLFTCAVLAAMCGTSVAIAAMVGAFAFSNLKKYGYSLPLSMGIVAGGGALGILIPPSVPMILYSSFSEQSTGKLFISGIIPGLVAVGLFSMYTVIAYSRGKERIMAKKTTWGERIKATKKGIWGLLVPVGIIIPLYAGWATPTETAAIGILWALVVGLFIYKEITFKDIFPILEEGVLSSVMVLFIISGAMVFGNAATQIGLSEMIKSFAVSSLSPINFIILTIIIVIIMGMFLEGASIMLIVLPIFLPALMGFGVNLFWYAVILVIGIEVALLTPPVGLNLYAVDGIAKSLGYRSNLTIAIKGTFPFMLLYLVAQILVLIFPQLALWLPSMMK